LFLFSLVNLGAQVTTGNGEESPSVTNSTTNFIQVATGSSDDESAPIVVAQFERIDIAQSPKSSSTTKSLSPRNKTASPKTARGASPRSSSPINSSLNKPSRSSSDDNLSQAVESNA
jgi:hypothetical protein